MEPLTRREIIDGLTEVGFRPRKKWGQNFLFDTELLDAFVRDTELPAGVPVVEVGCGAGTLTERLLLAGHPVVGLEIDPLLSTWLRRRFDDEPRFELIEGDALGSKNELAAHVRERLGTFDQPYWLVSNLPYAVATPITQLLLPPGGPGELAGMGVLVQREVAEKWVAAIGSADYGTASVLLQLAGSGSIVRRVSASLFWPRPQVESAFYVWRAGEPCAELEDVRRAVRHLFQQRRKMLRSPLAEWFSEDDPWWAAAGVSPTARPAEVGPHQFHDLAIEWRRRGGLGQG